MKTKNRNTGELEIAIVVAILLLVIVIFIAIRVNRQACLPDRQVLQEEEKIEEVTAVKKPIVAIKEEFPEEVVREGEFIEDGERKPVFIEEIRQEQMRQLKADIKKRRDETKDVPAEEMPAKTGKYDIYPREKEIKKMEEEKVLLY